MSGVNKVLILGNLGKDPEITYTKDGTPIANLHLSTTELWKDENSDEIKEQVEWHSVVLSGRLAEIAEQYLRSGSKIFVEGKLQTRLWEDSDGEHRYITQVIAKELRMLDSADNSKPDNDEFKENDEAEDDMPF